MWLSYSDSEVNCFHPVCEEALNQALVLIHQETQYSVLHHQYTGSLEMDYVIQNNTTGKYLCVVEVKRTPSDVHSARYQFQAMSYVQMNADKSEKPFYILTNLECAFTFRYDPTRPRVFQQMLQPGFTHIGDFKSDDKDSFIGKLAHYFSACLKSFIEDDYDYLLTLEEFATHMEHIKDNPKMWKTHLAALLYEYIRGSFDYYNRNELRDIRLFRNDVARICNEAARVNFKDIFTFSEDLFEKNINIDNGTLSDLYDFGNQNINGDSVAGILHSIVSTGHEHDGEVPTDLELARIVSELAKYSNGELLPNEYVCDPAAGSGNLISAAIPTFNLLPTQIKVNDVNKKLLELLSLRLGLNFPETVCLTNSPSIHNNNLADLKPDFFKSVKVIVMNPPFLAGINCVTRKQPLYKSIETITGHSPATNEGQMPLEAVFLELLIELVDTGTTISCVFPKTHLMGRGNEAKIIRRLLLNRFGLHLVFTYPGNEIFDDVTKDTCVIVGKAKTPSKKVKVVSSYDKIPDIDIHRFSRSLYSEAGEEFSSTMPGIVMKEIPSQTLASDIDNGWRTLNCEMVEAIMFVKDYFQNSNCFIELSELNSKIKRGQAGNNGGSDILFFDSRPELYNEFEDKKIPFSVGMRNAKHDSFDVGSGDSKFLNINNLNDDIIENILDTYTALPQRVGRQQRNNKTKEEWKSILSKEGNKSFPENSVLIPRAIRKTGRVHLSTKPVYVSTNFVVCSLSSFEKALLLSTWMSTIFYQLICEVSSKDQEGMRKMEVTDIEKTLVPKIENISNDDIAKLKSIYRDISFLNLCSPEIREIDTLWATILFGEKGKELLDHAQRMLGYLCNRRNS